MHQGQFHKAIEQDKADERRQLMEAARRICQIAQEEKLSLEAFELVCNKMAASTCNQFLDRYAGIDDLPPFLAQALSLVKSRSESLRSEWVAQIEATNKVHNSLVKRIVRGVTPPILYSAAKSILKRPS